MESSSAALTPGATAAAAAFRARATTCPASAIAASCAAVLICMAGSRLIRIMPPASPLFTVPAVGARTSSPHETAQGVQGPIGDLIHRAGGVDAEQDALVGVERDQRRGLLLVHH